MKTLKKSDRPLGVVLHRGIAAWNGGKYVVIACFGESENRKTGPMVQVYILADNGEKPTDAIKSGDDATVCHDCPMRGILAKYAGRRRIPADLIGGGGEGNACYVNAGQSVQSVYHAYQAGRYETYDLELHDRWFYGRSIRWGAYGEPVLIPLWIVEHLSGIADGWTGYTHQFHRREFQAYRRYFMASVHNHTIGRAVELGWRMFYAGTTIPAEYAHLFVDCPASEESGFKKQCIDCKACRGNCRPVGDSMAKSISINPHGGIATMRNVQKLAILQ